MQVILQYNTHLLKHYTILVIFQFGFPIYSRNKRNWHSQTHREGGEPESCGGQLSRTPSFEDYDDVRDFFP